MTFDIELKSLMSAILRELNEAGEENLCALANTVLAGRTDLGSDAALQHYLTAVHHLCAAEMVRLRQYRSDEPRPLTGNFVKDPFAAIPWFDFDPDSQSWRWSRESRLNVELP